MSQMTDKRNHVEIAFGNVGLVMSSDEKWNTLLDHIESYITDLEGKLGTKLSFFDGVFCYHENIYIPLKHEMNSWRVGLMFRGKNKSDLYLEMAEHWFELMKEDADVFADVAVRDYTYKEGKNPVTSYIMKEADKAYDYYSSKFRFA